MKGHDCDMRSSRIGVFVQWICISSAVAFIILSIMIVKSVIKMDIQTACEYSYIFILFVIISTSFDRETGIFGIGKMPIYYLVLVSFGFPFGYLIDKEYTISRLITPKMLYAIYFDKYIAISVIALSAYIIGVKAYSLARNARPPIKADRSTHDESLHENDIYFRIGMIFICLFTVYLLYNWTIGKIPNEYLAFKLWSDTQIFNYSKILFWIGIIFILASGTKAGIIKATIFISVPMMILVSTGNRNDVMYPVLIGIGIYYYRFRKIPKLLVLAIALFIFIISPIISFTRSTGVLLSDGRPILMLIVDSLIEMGGQVASVSQMFAWLDNGEKLAYGQTYIYASGALIMGTIVPSIREAYFQSRYSIETRLPSIAFTMPAEMYFNFSYIGPAISYVLFGVYTMKNESYSMPREKLVVYSFVVFLMLHWTRNQFYFSAAYIIIFTLVYILEKHILRPIVNRTSVTFKGIF